MPPADSAAARGAGPPDDSLLSEYIEISQEAAVLRRTDPAGTVDPRLLEVKEAIEAVLSDQVASRQNQRRTAAFFAGAGVIQGVGIGAGPEVGGGFIRPGEGVLTVYVAEDVSADRVRSMLVDSFGVRSEAVFELPISVVVTGPIEALVQTSRVRPAPGGFSVSVVDNEAGSGTIGCLAYGRTPPRDSRTLLVSCNHVIGNSNSGVLNACVVQPGASDGGFCSNDQIAVLERVVTINFNGTPNYVDCASAWCFPERVRPELASQSVTGLGFFRMSNSPAPVTPNMAVGKTGRSTGLTLGYVDTSYTTCTAYYPGDRAAVFKDQIAIRGSGGPFSDRGDSGAVVWTWDGSLRPVGLLFSGATALDGHITFANPISYVLSALDIDLAT